MLALQVLRYLILLSCLSVLMEAKINEIDTKSNLISTATKRFIAVFFTKLDYATITINIAATNYESTEIGNEIIKGMGNKLATTVRGHQRKFKEVDKRHSSVILLLDSINSFNILKVQLNRVYPKYYLILLIDGLFEEVDEIIKVLWSMSITNVNFLISNGTHGLMYSFYPFDDGKCGTDLSLHLINTFNPISKHWESSTFYPEKVRNLNNCELSIGLTENIPMVILSNKSNEQHFDGAEVLLIRNLAQEFNFSPKFVNHESIGIASGNRSSGLLGALYNRKNDIAIGTLSLQIDRTQYLSATSMFASIPIVAVIPPQPFISPFEKFFIPFDITTWILLFAMFFIGYAVILISKLISIALYRIIVGHKVPFPFTNMLIAFFGGTQVTLPKGNFSRFLLAKFLLFCLVIRSLYQGQLFDIMKKDIYEKTPTTFDDLMAKGYTFYAYESLSRRMQGLKFAKSVHPIKNSEIELYRQKTLDSSFNGIVFSYEPQVIYMNFMNKNSHAYLILNERLVTNQMVFYLQENHFLTEHFQEIINWFREFGITNFILSEYIDPLYMKKFPPSSKSEPLTLKELSAVFYIWFGGLGAAGVVCLLEIGIGCKKSIVGRLIIRKRQDYVP
ncbi:glutamate receptor ionotropic, NMDA 3B-like [Chironomus tepperi]|uniref:glutamate receptor ionotropic, NMDA 3B-like n=1 Tax=Chironomus tepperi TaxID=113505 RepID=UPI00391F36F0